MFYSINLTKIIRWLFYVFVFLLPWQTRWIIVGSPIPFQQISLYGFDIVLIIIYVLVVSSKVKSQKSKLQFKTQNNDNYALRFTLYALSLLALASLFWSFNESLAVYWSLRLILAVGLIWLVRQINFKWQTLAWIFIIVISLQAIIGIGQFLLQDDLLVSKWLGASQQEAWQAGTSVIENSAGRWLRAHGTQPHPNVLGGLLVVGLILCLSLLPSSLSFKLQAQNPKQIQNSKSNNPNFSNLLLVVSCLLLVTALFFTFSRSAWLAALIIGIIYLLTTISQQRLTVGPSLRQRLLRLRQISKATVLLYITIWLVILVNIYWPLVASRFSSSPRLEQQAIEQRISGYEQAWSVIKPNPILGVGIGNYTGAVQENNPDLPDYLTQPVHNVFLLITAELGLIGLLAFLLTLILIIRYFLSILHFPFYPQKISFLILLDFLIIGLIDHYFWTLPPFVLIFWLTLGLSLKKNIQHGHSQ